MKKLIALFAVTTLASTSAVASIALSGSASVTYDDQGSSASATSYDADLTITGTAGTTTLTATYDMHGANPATEAVTKTSQLLIITDRLPGVITDFASMKLECEKIKKAMDL